MEVRDPVHGSIHILNETLPILENEFFKRLRGIKQLGLSEFIFPGATHTRFIHSLGVMSIAEKVSKQIFKNHNKNNDIIRLIESLKIACLLHDIGHAPLSHSTESVMPTLKDLQLPSRFTANDDLSRQATHEDYTIKAVTDSSLTDDFARLKKSFGVDPNAVADLIIGKTSDNAYFTVNNKNYFPILHQLVSSELDCDRMDYLLRDSYFCGVSYGHFDLDWVIDNLIPCDINNEINLGITERSVSTFDDFLLSRYHMFLMVYFHYKSVCLEQLLFRYFQSSSEYAIPAKIEEYLEHDDHHLMKILRDSDNTYAKDIVHYNIPEKIFESFNANDEKKALEIEKFLQESEIEYIKCSSRGRLSKYYDENAPAPEYRIKVRKEYTKESQYMDINQATNLFHRYSDSHSITRLHCWTSRIGQKTLGKIQEMI